MYAAGVFLSITNVSLLSVYNSTISKCLYYCAESLLFWKKYQQKMVAFVILPCTTDCLKKKSQKRHC